MFIDFSLVIPCNSILSSEIVTHSGTFIILSLIFGYIPILTPISILITVLLLAMGFIDYSWSRHDISFSDCKIDLRRNFLSYAIGGGVFMVIVSVPIINIIVPSLATSYFTVLWIKNNEYRNQITK